MLEHVVAVEALPAHVSAPPTICRQPPPPPKLAEPENVSVEFGKYAAPVITAATPAVMVEAEVDSEARATVGAVPTVEPVIVDGALKFTAVKPCAKHTAAFEMIDTPVALNVPPPDWQVVNWPFTDITPPPSVMLLLMVTGPLISR